ncbi:D-glycerate dehydrogenase [Viridibacillus sp. FSL R5-0477]|uniref:D-isomer specific 2-hydroxyacid dehydrogenase NAD-binding subunit n=1 Tax=Viridibacillus arenosi FSL R5-213 TaxID=1227360 RepID=W4F4T6_9BACL|nr:MULTISPECIES: D-glycerate dehydrogenase [Viridibacillus]ETT87347.1 D-isomer specific 2-hydroxyacid dehydrogenase NAD-binding subunit [Viridibacillus arenosi FSL R5-213]OMC82419.1 D-glycerate dehydrogenase [Viridibacillus sp. FSL H8-0123]OMC87832.1 D-glycerate dehydrogenase [Viridibacillus sp. FSL H7-0596]OMC91382.1 D-glycerate dehydrogenase [Viridibacillus arenosi]
MKPLVWITRQLPEESISPLREIAEVKMWSSADQPMPAEELKQAAGEADAMWVMISDQITREVIEVAPKLKIIANLAVGYNNIDIKAAKEKGVIVTNTPDVLTGTTADLAFALMLATARRIPEAEREVRNGKWTGWSVNQLTGMDIHGATLGVVGMGRIGEAVARRGMGFDMRILYHNRTRKPEAEEKYGFEYAELDTLLKESDFVVLLTPLTPETKGLIGKSEIALMKNSAILINVARGGVVDEQALYEALLNKEIWAAGLDVFETEPVPTDHPLLTLPNVVVLPHIGSASIRTRNNMMAKNTESIAACLQGKEIKNPVK